MAAENQKEASSEVFKVLKSLVFTAPWAAGSCNLLRLSGDVPSYKVSEIMTTYQTPP
jgi:hypothetical protein